MKTQLLKNTDILDDGEVGAVIENVILLQEQCG